MESVEAPDTMWPRVIHRPAARTTANGIDAPMVIEATILVVLQQGEIDRVDVGDGGLEPPLAVLGGEGAQQPAVGIDHLGRARPGSARGWAGRGGRAPTPPSPGRRRQGRSRRAGAARSSSARSDRHAAHVAAGIDARGIHVRHVDGRQGEAARRHRAHDVGDVEDVGSSPCPRPTTSDRGACRDRRRRRSGRRAPRRCGSA